MLIFANVVRDLKVEIDIKGSMTFRDRTRTYMMKYLSGELNGYSPKQPFLFLLIIYY